MHAAEAANEGPPGKVRLALAGDTMLGRRVGDALRAGQRPETLVAPEVVAAAREADLVVLNLECCISERGERWRAPGKPFFFRAPPSAVDLLVHLGVACVTLANNHALDYGPDALLDTLAHLERAGIEIVGAGADLEQARSPALLETAGLRLRVLAVADHPADFAAARGRPGIAFADLRAAGIPTWLKDALLEVGADATLVTPHWGPNMTPAPVPHVRAAAEELVAAGATLVAGHSAHVFHGVAGSVLFDLGDFLDDYARDAVLRNDLGLLWLVDLDRAGVQRIEALPLKLEHCFTRLAEGADAKWIESRFRAACADLGTEASTESGRLVIDAR